MRKRRYHLLSQEKEVYTEETPIPVVHNIVATSRIEFNFEELDLVKIQTLLPFSFYDKKRFAAVTVRMSSPECTALLFSSGRLVITGARTWYESIYSTQYICKLLQNIYPDKIFHLRQCDIQNIVGHVELPIEKGQLDLDAMYQHLQLNCTYQKLLFPGLIFRPENSPVVLLCFYSGRIVITGGKTLKDIYEGWASLWPIIRKFIHTNPISTSSSIKKTKTNFKSLEKSNIPTDKVDMITSMPHMTYNVSSSSSSSLQSS